MRRLLLALTLLLPLGANADEPLPLFDVHVHYSHDAWTETPPAEAIRRLRAAGLKRAFVSSSSDDGTLMLLKEAPDLVIPVLRPYRKRGELGSWHDDATVVEMVAARLAERKYAGVGEFHVSGSDADKPVVRGLVKLADEHEIFLHAHSDADAVRRIFAQDPEARVLWAHAGFERLPEVRAMLERYDNLWVDLAFRFGMAGVVGLEPDWLRLFLDFPDRFMVGVDTYTPSRWGDVGEYADWARGWLKALPDDVARKIAYENADRLAAWALKN